MLLASSIKDTLCDVQWIYCNKMFCYHTEDLDGCVNIDTASWQKKNFSFSSSDGAGGGQKAHKLEGEL